MPKFGLRSEEQLETCCDELQFVAREVIKIYDCSVLEGHRPVEKQNRYFLQGKSKIDGIIKKGKHNYTPSQAMDLMPYPGELHGVNVWSDFPRFYLFMGLVNGVARSNGIILRFGCDWNGDGSTADQSFHDLPHVETVN